MMTEQHAAGQIPRWLTPLGWTAVGAGMAWSLVLIGIIGHFFLSAEGYVDYVDGLVLFHQSQAAAGKNVYDPAFRDAPPYSVPLYGPVFYYLVGAIMGERPSLLPGRLISAASMLGVCGLAWAVLRRRFRLPAALALIGSVPWLALRGPLEFGVNNRVDSLAVLFGVAGLLTALIDRVGGWRWSIPLLLLAGFTKPTAAVSAGLAVFLDLALAQRFRSAAAFAAVLGTGAFAGLWIGDACSAGNFSQCLVRSHSELRWLVGVHLTAGACKQPILPLGIFAACFLLRDPATRVVALHAVICFLVAVATSGKVGSNYNYFLEPSWAAVFCFALALSRWRWNPAYGWAVAATGVLLIQSAARMTPHVVKHYDRIAQWPQTVLAVQKYGERGPLLTMQVGAQVLSGQQPYVADVFVLSCLNRAGRFDLGPVLEDLRRQYIAAVIARDDIRPDLPGDVIWTDRERELVAAYYRPIERFGDLTVYVPRANPRSDVAVRASKDDDWTGPYFTYHQNGQKASETDWAQGRKHGVERFWDDGGRLWREVHYVDGTKLGPETTWHENGQMASRVEYLGGRRHGLEVTWYANGRKWTQTHYVDGVPDGPAIRWDPDGRVAGETFWDRGVLRNAW